MAVYIWDRSEWPHLTYDSKAILNPLAEAVERHGLLIGRLEGLGFGDLQDAKLEAISAEVVKSSEIEGEKLDYDTVRSSIARRLGIDAGGVPSGDHRIEGVVEMALDAAENWNEPLTKGRLFNWHAGLFPGGRGPQGAVKTGGWRDDAKGPIQVVSGPMGKENVHYEAPPASRVDGQMDAFLSWFNSDTESNGILRAGIAHLWFVTIHPFDDGNGRVGRAVLDLALARHDKRRWRGYSVSAQIRKERKGYYDALERAQHGDTDVTLWLAWYLGCLQNSFEASAESVAGAISRTRFWQQHADKDLNDRQRKVLQKMLVGWEGKMTNKMWQGLTKSIPKTAMRDLEKLVEMGIFDQVGSGRGTWYRLKSGDTAVD